MKQYYESRPFDTLPCSASPCPDNKGLGGSAHLEPRTSSPALQDASGLGPEPEKELTLLLDT